MYFENLRFGESLAIVVTGNDIGLAIDNGLFSDTAKEQLNGLNKRIKRLMTADNRQALLDIKKSDSDSREIIENYFIYSVNDSKKEDLCEAFFKAALFTLPVFEEFCLILKDFIETQKKLTDGREIGIK